jgi:hypothetical protein
LSLYWIGNCRRSAIARRFQLSSDDLAYAAFSAAGTAALVGHDLRALGIPSMSDHVDAYMARTGLDPRPALPVYLAYNFSGSPRSCRGIIGRVRDGTADE